MLLSRYWLVGEALAVELTVVDGHAFGIGELVCVVAESEFVEVAL